MDNIVIKRGFVTELEKLPDYSIALDGLVPGPQVDPEHHRFSFDHHDGCLRFCTTSACMQAWTAVQLGLEDLEQYQIYANDVDIDVCASIWCLKNPDRCKEPLVKKLIDAIGLGDMHAGAISLNGMTKIVEWICEPETSSKRCDDYHKISNDGLKSILEAVLYRIDQYVDGESNIEPSKQLKHCEFKMLRNEHDWVLVEANDPHVFSSIYQSGFTKMVLVRPQTDGSLAITLAKKSDFVGNFPMRKFYDELNKKEYELYLELNKTREEGSKLDGYWNGSSSVGGAPRNSDGSRTHLPLKTIIETIDSIIS